MPAAAVIPAPRVSVVNAAVKRSVVDAAVYVCVPLREWTYAVRGATDEAQWIVGREVKCEDPDWTDRGEGAVLGRVFGSRTKAGGSKSIRYRFSSSSKRCRLDGGGPLWQRNRKYVGSGDSMLARVKLKEIDGRTPPGVECAA